MLLRCPLHEIVRYLPWKDKLNLEATAHQTRDRLLTTLPIGLTSSEGDVWNWADNFRLPKDDHGLAIASRYSIPRTIHLSSRHSNAGLKFVRAHRLRTLVCHAGPDLSFTGLSFSLLTCSLQRLCLAKMHFTHSIFEALNALQQLRALWLQGTADRNWDAAFPSTLPALEDVRLELPPADCIPLPPSIRCLRVHRGRARGHCAIERYWGQHWQPTWPLRALCFDVSSVSVNWTSIQFPVALQALAFEGDYCPSEEFLLPIVRRLPALREFHTRTVVCDETFMSLVTSGLHTVGILGGISKDCVTIASALGLKYLRLFAANIDNLSEFLSEDAAPRRPFGGFHGPANADSKEKDLSTAGSTARVRVLTENSTLCYWWQMGVDFDEFSWYLKNVNPPARNVRTPPTRISLLNPTPSSNLTPKIQTFYSLNSDLQ
eukprot:GEMP01040500.1.p1 GENE.GEMP01040500.1~~GEMP01040500.1.p1  ORF type:complete len:432 (+),score=65.71 GEMP01040500.1:187-1482(+)